MFPILFDGMSPPVQSPQDPFPSTVSQFLSNRLSISCSSFGNSLFPPIAEIVLPQLSLKQFSLALFIDLDLKEMRGGMKDLKHHIVWHLLQVRILHGFR